MLKAGQARTVLLVGAEVHSGFMPWTVWEFLLGRGGKPPTPEEKAVVTRFRDRTVLLGDAAGAVVQKALGLPDERMYNNIQKYGNTTAATIPIALDECRKSGRIQPGQLVCFVGLGSGFHWGAALMRA
jgi:3-oxoacyl-[acyl-carrier-protein] synthase III